MAERLEALRSAGLSESAAAEVSLFVDTLPAVHCRVEAAVRRAVGRAGHCIWAEWNVMNVMV